MNLPDTIEGLINDMDTMIEQSIAENNPLGLFTALYQKVTIRVKEGIANGRFEDGPRMEQLDIIFANRYLEAYQKYQSGRMPTRSWKATFDAAKRTDLILLQHLLLGMNAHINLDLGIAAAQVNPGASIEALKNDFIEINKLLFELIEEVQSDLAKVSPFLGLVDFLGKNKDEQFAAFSMKAARKHAWLVAQRMASVTESGREAVIESTDKYVVALNKVILNPGKLISIINWIIRLVESKNVAKNIQALRLGERSEG
ncbi:MAG: hypothetical protein ACI8P3_002283 [Saprospiraceae bacterium]|jgi:hypothetical protein